MSMVNGWEAFPISSSWVLLAEMRGMLDSTGLLAGFLSSLVGFQPMTGGLKKRENS